MLSSGLVGDSTHTSRAPSSLPGLEQLLRGDVVEPVALRLVDLREHPVHPAVDVVHADDAVARIDEVHDRGRGAEARREREPVVGLLEGCETVLERRSRRVRDPGVVVALVHPDRLLGEGRGLVDRRRHRARRGIGLLSGVDRPRLEVHGGMVSPVGVALADQDASTTGARRRPLEDRREHRGVDVPAGHDADDALLLEPARQRRRERERAGALGDHVRAGREEAHGGRRLVE